MAWQEVSPGRHERPLDIIEQFFAGLAAAGGPIGREHWSITAAIRLELGLQLTNGGILQALRKAWLAVRHDFPQIACILEGDRKVYTVPTDEEIVFWLDKTFIVEAPGTTSQDLFANFRPSPLASLHWLPGSSEMVVHTSHWRIDGIGFLIFLDRLINAVCKPREVVFGSEAKNLSPSLEQAANIPQQITPGLEEAAETLFNEYVTNLPTLGLLYCTQSTSSTLLPGPTRRQTLTLDPEATTEIIVACKSRGISVTAAVHAAVVVATQSNAPKELLGRKYTSFCATNLRPYLDPPYDSQDHPVALYFTGLPVALPPASFSTLSQKMQAIYGRSFSRATSNLLDILAAYTRRTTSLMTQAPPPEMPVPSEPNVNSLGVVDRYLQTSYGEGELRIIDLWLAVEMLTKQLEVYVWTYQGKMQLSACYNEAFYSSDFVAKFLDQTHAILQEELNGERA
ncbi:MAG: hypothetical protein L6R39_002332 [Caloplaca ligustica]|nr:MAG: hypothetical protein L6R39_002332 [Caloplaca ligustica]